MSEKGKRPQEAGIQNPPGVSKEAQNLRFKTTREDIVEMPIRSIQQCPLIPDYKDPTESTLPIVVHTPEAFFCIDGWNLIEQAQAEGQSNVRCHVFQIQEHSDTELAIRKVAVRTKPVGGTCCYAELVRNANLVANILMDEMENPIVFSHGGSRRGAFFTNNREDDLREVLSERLGKDRSTINAYLNFGRYLTNEAIHTLVEQNTGRAFFEKAQINKRRWISNLKSDGLDEESITTQISSKMLEWREEYQESGNIKTDHGETEEEGDQTTESSSASTSTDENGPSSEQVNPFNHRSPPTDSEAPVLPQIEDVKAIMQEVADTLAGLVHQSSFDCDQAIEIIDEQIKQLVMARQIAIDIRDRAAKEEA
jgi:hypothetical protein